MPDTVTSIPLVDLAAQHAQIADEVLAGWHTVLENTSFVLGGEVREFESEFASFSEVEHCVGVANGTDALELALRAIGVGAGDEVIVPANTFIASALAVRRAGAKVVLADAVEQTHLVDPERAAERVTPATKAIMPVHLYGQMAEMERFDGLVSGTPIRIVEDAAQAQGARRAGEPAGGLGSIAGTSFYPGKNLGAYGDAGAVLTRDEELARRVRNLRNYGSDVKYHHPEPGFNSRLDTLQAVVLRAKLRHLAQWNEARRTAARRYDELLAGVDQVTRPVTAPGNQHVWHLYVIRVPNRDDVVRSLNEQGVGAGIHYPVPVHLQGAFADLGHRRGDFPVAEKAADEILSLPLFAEITPSQQEHVVQSLLAALR